MSNGEESAKETCKQSITMDLIKSLSDLAVRNNGMSFNIANSLLGQAPTSKDDAEKAATPPPQGMLPQMIQSLKEIRARIIDANRDLEKVQNELGI